VSHVSRSPKLHRRYGTGAIEAFWTFVIDLIPKRRDTHLESRIDIKSNPYLCYDVVFLSMHKIFFIGRLRMLRFDFLFIFLSPTTK
jgi:hypothetical protein